MLFVLKLIGCTVAAALLLAAVGVWDLMWNGSDLFYHLVGRDALVGECTPMLKENLSGRGFSPVDLTFGDTPSMSTVSGSLGRSKSLADDFTFSDGENGPRVDGHLVCTVAGATVQVNVDVATLPRRVT